MREFNKTTYSLVILTLVAVFAAGLVSCNSSGCTDNRSAIPLAGFYNSTDGFEVTLDSLEIYGIGAPGDSMVLSAGDAVNTVYLPMRSTKSSTAWCIAYKEANLDSLGVRDTITLDYFSQPYLADDECGAMYNYRLRKVSHTSYIIDSIGVVDSLITNADVVSIKIYFRTNSRNDF